MTQSRTPITDRLNRIAAQRIGVVLDQDLFAAQSLPEPLWTVTVPAHPEFSARLHTADQAARTALGLSRTYGQAEVSDGTKVVAQYVRGQVARWQG